ncbi:hypothetical protein HWV00_04110 [Moritella sp. 24]|nr:hypothetical protein HWV00_04110 [Moritella sp. 24]
MISLTLVGVILTGIYSVFSNHEIQKNRAEQYYIVQQEAHNILTIMQRELARAGYTLAGEGVKPFIYNNDEIYILNPRQDCIMYRYDRNEDGVFSHESFGFRLHNGGLQQRKGSEVSCEGGLGWEMISDSASTKISALQFIISEQIQTSPYRVKGYVIIKLRIGHRQLTDIELSFSRNSSARAFL